MNKLEEMGHRVFWPPRDNKFEDTDQIGIDIIMSNMYELKRSDEVHVIFDPNSQGSIADIEAAMYGGKPIYLVNPHQLHPTEGKSYTNVVLNFLNVYEPSKRYDSKYGFVKVKLEELLKEKM
ncbi:MAG: hypothetical protein QW478_15010 [Candidatus Micrarchaeaceae archaeon]